MKRIIIIGGGAAGMMAAIAAAEIGAAVTLLEKNEKLGKKIYITGKGRCNVTNACDTDSFFDSLVTNPRFLYSAYYGYDNQEVIRFFEEAGCKLKEERGARIFPVSDHASDIISALQRKLKQLKVEVRLNTNVEDLLTEAKAVSQIQVIAAGDKNINEARILGVKLVNGEILRADAVIVATGGKSYPTTGSTGDGYKFGKKTGHTIKEIIPALVPFTVKEAWCMQMQGVSLKNVSIALWKDRKLIYEGFGEMLFTHFGVSGPLILSASSYYAQKYYGQEVTLNIDLKPALSREQLDKRLLRDIDDNKHKQFKNILGGLLPSSMVPVVIQLSGIEAERKVNQITKEERIGLAELLKGLTMHVTGTRDINEAIITQGGIHVKEINASTMESKKVRGLYFAGEVLDVDALTGGFNMQIAWSTGHLAGVNAGTQNVID